MGILGPAIVAGAPALRILAVLGVIRAIGATLGPVLFLIGAQRQAAGFIGVALVVKVAVIAALAPRFGYVGIAWAAVGIEAVFALAPSVYILQRITGCRVRWTVPAKIAVVLATTAAVPWVLPMPALVAAVVAPFVYTALAFATSAARLADLRALRAGAATA
jgi:O-antigen/teichoic acid export membrane protein